jgi:hypothetical protein
MNSQSFRERKREEREVKDERERRHKRGQERGE